MFLLKKICRFEGQERSKLFRKVAYCRDLMFKGSFTVSKKECDNRKFLEVALEYPNVDLKEVEG